MNNCFLVSARIQDVTDSHGHPQGWEAWLSRPTAPGSESAGQQPEQTLWSVVCRTWKQFRLLIAQDLAAGQSAES